MNWLSTAGFFNIYNMSLQNHDDLYGFKPQLGYYFPYCFKDLVLAKNVGIASHKEIFSFVYENVNYIFIS